MRILLIGEFSGYYNNLADGLKYLGHKVFLANTGDGYRQFYYDYNWMSSKKGKIGNILGLFDLFKNRKIFTGFDVVQVIAPKINRFLHLNKSLLNYLLHNNRKVFWTPCGASDLVINYWANNNELRCDYFDFIIEDAKIKNKKLSFEKSKFIKYEKWFVNKISGIIPVAFEYAQPFRNHLKYLCTIPFPVNTDKILFEENIVKDKVIFYHGVTRPEKGTKFICAAFEKMKTKFKKEAKFICNERLPYNQYLKVMQETNVIVDQTNSFSSGLNGLIALAQGKIVMGGATRQSLNELGYKSCPIINITPNVDQICNEIEKIIINRDKISKYGEDSRLFIETYHDYIHIAQKYLNTWG